MSSILRKLENAVNPERREYRAAAAADAPPGSVVLNPNDPRAPAANTANTASPAYASGAANYAANTGTTAAGTHQNPPYPQSAGRHGAQGPAAATQEFPGPAPNTAGPHRHDFLNRLDPRVDSDMSMSGAPAGTYASAQGRPAEAARNYGPHTTRLGDATNARGDVGPYDGYRQGGGGGVDGGVPAAAAAPEAGYTYGAPYETQAGRVGEGKVQGGGGTVPRTMAPGEGRDGQGHVLPLGPGTVNREEFGRGNVVPGGQGAAVTDARRNVQPSQQAPMASGARVAPDSGRTI